MTNYRITAAIVIFNKEIKDSVTCQCIKSISSEVDILVLDNSVIKNNNREICDQLGYRYISMNGNEGLSKAYNKAVDNSQYSDLIILFDDDTEVTSEYFDKLYEALEQNPDADIFAPVIRGQDGVIYSPNSFNFLRNKFISSSEQVVPQDSFNAIASCLAIRMRVFTNYRFNESLFVDQVDQFFFCEQRKLGRKFVKLNVEILQHFYQRGDGLSPETGWRRLKMRIVDIYRHASLMDQRKYVVLAFIKCCGLGVQIGRKSKSFHVIVKAFVLSFVLLFNKS